MAKEKGSTPTSGDKTSSNAKKSSTPNIFSIFAVGAIIGLAMGFLLGWWYPAPSTIRNDIDSTKQVASDKMEGIAKHARDKTADLLEERAKQLRHPLGHITDSTEDDDMPLEPVQNSSGVPVE